MTSSPHASRIRAVAYLARIAFGHAGEASYRVFYNDFAAALRWLEDHAT
jgi:CRISPR/Cas system endoribonuclease Cas6 (RAMP superfamily)